MEFKLDKENWEKVKFGDVAIQLKGTVNRADTDLKYYVKGEHMNTDDIHIREFGELTDEYLGPAFIRYFKPGDILYGSRRTYLKKVAVAHIEGITSNTTFVIDARENFLNKSLIPFLMLSDGFTKHSIMHSKGSVNPYVNWKDLANYEFLLPPKLQQAELAELLWAMDEVIEKDLVVLEKLEKLIKSKRNSLAQSGKSVALRDFIKLNYGKALKDSERVEGNFSVVSSSGIQGTHNISMVEGPGIVLGRKGNAGELIWVSNDFWVIDTAYYITVCEEYKSYGIKAVYHLLKSVDFKKDVTATAVPGLNRDDALNRYIHIPNKVDLLEFTEQIEAMENIKNESQTKLQSSRALQKSLINQLF